jgi:hypothetical protein
MKNARTAPWRVVKTAAVMMKLMKKVKLSTEKPKLIVSTNAKP